MDSTNTTTDQRREAAASYEPFCREMCDSSKSNSEDATAPSNLERSQRCDSKGVICTECKPEKVLDGIGTYVKELWHTGQALQLEANLLESRRDGEKRNAHRILVAEVQLGSETEKRKESSSSWRNIFPSLYHLSLSLLLSPSPCIYLLLSFSPPLLSMSLWPLLQA